MAQEFFDEKKTGTSLNPTLANYDQTTWVICIGHNTDPCWTYIYSYITQLLYPMLMLKDGSNFQQNQ